jgi:hypothetical protein
MVYMEFDSHGNQDIRIPRTLIEKCGTMFTNEELEATRKLGPKAMEAFVRNMSRKLDVSMFLCDITMSIVYEARKVEL